MNVGQLKAVMRKEWWHIVRDRNTAVLVMFSPVLFLVVLAYSFSVDIKQVSIAIMDQDRTPASQDYVARLAASGDLTVCCHADSYDEISDLILKGEAKAAVVIAPGFQADLESGESASVQVVVDGSDPNTAGHAITHVVSRTDAFGAQRLTALLERQGLVPPEDMATVDLRVRTWYNPSLSYIDGMIPALIAVVLSMPAVAAALAISREKEWGTYEALVATPIGRVELLVGKLLPYVGSGMISAVLCAAVAIGWFGVPLKGGYLAFLALTLDFLLATLAIGVLISVFVRSQQAAMIIALLVFLFPGFFLSGILIPLSAMGVMKLESYMMPTTHYVLINRGLFNKGVGIGTLWPYALALAVVAVLALLVSVLVFKKRVG
jgi:ABC-2 type transport system permease protein